MTAVMEVHKRCVMSGRALRAESAASEIQHMKIHLRQTLQNRSKCMHERRFAVMSSLHLFKKLITLRYITFFKSWKYLKVS